MSNTPIEVLELGCQHSGKPSPSNCHHCRHSQLQNQSSQSQDSSSQESSQSISIHVNAKNMQHTALKFQQLQNQIKELQAQNCLLVRKNKDLMSKIAPAKISQKQLRRELKEKETEIMQLKNQLSMISYGMSSPSKIGYDSLSRHQLVEEKISSAKSKSKTKHHKKQQSSASSQISQQFDFDEQKLFKKQWQAQRLLLQRQICQLQQKVFVYEHQIKWTMSLAYKMVNLGDKLAYLFKQKVTDHKWGLRRQTKAAWRYLKHILSYLLLIEQ